MGETSPPSAAIVITVPSSPDDPPVLAHKLLRTPPLHAFDLDAPSDITSSITFARDSLSPQPILTQDHNMSPFQDRLEAAELPSSGVDLYNARRALWWTPGPEPPPPTEANPSRRRLESLLARPGALEDDEVWNTGLDRVWRGLTGGAKLKHRLPLGLVIKILQAGWIREGTWPKGAFVPDSDEALNTSGADLHADLSTLSTTIPSITTSGTMDDDEGTPKFLQHANHVGHS